MTIEKRSYKKAFTLIEIMVVVTIIGIISGVVLANTGGLKEKQRIEKITHFDNEVFVELQDYLIAGYSFEEGSSGIASGKTRTQDGFGYNGTINGNPSWTEGIIGNALDFAGSNSWVNLGPMVLEDTVNDGITIEDEITVSAFIKSSNFNQNGLIVLENPVNSRWNFFFENNQLKWRGSYPVNNNISCDVPTTNGWHHILGTQKDTVAKIYINGVLCVEDTASAIRNGTGDVEIGRFNVGSGYYYSGQIDELKIYSKAYGFDE